MYRIAGLDVGNDLMLITINHGHLAGITLDDQEEVFPVAAMQRLAGIVLGLDIDLLPFLHQRKGHLRWDRWLMLDVLGHDLDFLRRHNVVEVIHAALGTQGDNPLQSLGARLKGILRLQVLAGAALTQHTMTAGTALEVDGLGGLKFLRRQLRRGAGGRRRAADTHTDRHGNSRQPQY